MILFSDLKAKAKALGFETLRTESDTYFEVVLLKAKLSDYNCALQGILGKISWPSDRPLTANIKAAIAQHGSVTPGQTLYSMQEGKHILFAMLWPWSDQEHITLKAGEKV